MSCSRPRCSTTEQFEKAEEALVHKAGKVLPLDQSKPLRRSSQSLTTSSGNRLWS